MAKMFGLDAGKLPASSEGNQVFAISTASLVLKDPARATLVDLVCQRLPHGSMGAEWRQPIACVSRSIDGDPE